MRDGEERSDNQEAASVRGCASVEHQLRRSAVTDHFHVVPQHTCGVAGAKRFHRGLFRGKSRGKVRCRVAPARTILDLAGGEDAPQEAVPVAREHLGYAGDVRRIDPNAYDSHGRASA